MEWFDVDLLIETGKYKNCRQNKGDSGADKIKYQQNQYGQHKQQ